MATKKEITKIVKETKITSIETLIKQSAKELKEALPSHLKPERLVRIALTAIRQNPKLAQCTPESFLGSLFVLAQIGIEPIAGRAYLIPFKNNRKITINGREEWRSFLEVQAVIGYKGLAELFYRHEAALTIDMQKVHQNDAFEYEYGTNSYLRHKPALQDRGPVIGYYAIAKLKHGGVVFRYMSKEECIEHGKKHSKTYDKKSGDFLPDSPWKTDTDAMCMKTVLIQLSKVLPLSVELQRAIAVDETAREYKKGIESPLDLPVTTNWEEPPIDIEPETEPLQKEQPQKQEQEEIIKEIFDTKPTSSLPENVLNTLKQLQQQVGTKKFNQILGSLGYETIEEIPNINEVNKLLTEISKLKNGGN